MQSTFNATNGPARLSDLNEEFDDSDDSDNEISNIRQDNEPDFSLSMFASNGLLLAPTLVVILYVRAITIKSSEGVF